MPTVALIDWGHVFEDFLGSIGLDLATFRTEMGGGWRYSYAEALRRAGVGMAFVCVSATVREPWRFTQDRSGIPVSVLPAPRAYRALRKRFVNPYAWSLDEAVNVEITRWNRSWLGALHVLAPYLATPLRVLARELRRLHCSALLCQEYESPRFDLCVLLGRRLQLPVFATFQGGNWQNGRVEAFLRPHALKHCAGVVVGSSREIERLRADYDLSERKIAHIFNPLDVAAWTPGDRLAAKQALGIPPASPTAVWHGRVLMQRKGLDVLTESWARVLRDLEGPEPTLVLVGTGDDHGALRERLDSLGTERILWVNEYVRDKAAIRRYLRAGDVYLFPSRHEGFAVAPVEAMALGLPLVAARAPGVCDVLADGERHGGVVVPTGDAAAFASALLSILSDPARAARLGEAARRRALEAFDLDSVGVQLRDFLLTTRELGDQPS